MTTDLAIERHGPVALIRLRSSDDYPKLTRALLKELAAALERIAADPSLRALVLTGNDGAFAAGADIAEVNALDGRTALAFAALGQSVMDRIERATIPVVAAIRGYCLGGGFDLALACHLRLASHDAVFGHPGGALGLMTGFGGTQRLARLIGRSRALALLATGQTISAEEAYRIFLVNQVVEAHLLEATALAWAQRAGPSFLSSSSSTRRSQVCDPSI